MGWPKTLSAIADGGVVVVKKGNKDRAEEDPGNY